MTPDALRNIEAQLRARARALRSEADALEALAMDFSNCAARSGVDTRMRPGIEPPGEISNVQSQPKGE